MEKTQEQMMFENKEIKGLSVRSLFWLITCTASIIFSIFTVYFNLKQQIQNMQIEKLGDLKYNELRLRDIDNKIDVNAIEIRELKNRLTDVESKK